MKLLSWNIQHGGGTRDVRIVSAIADHNPDIIALTEFRARPGMALCQAFAANGWPHIASSSPTGIDNGICVLSRTPLRCDRPSAAPPENAVRWLDVDLPEQGFGFTVIHILTANPGAKEPEGAAKTRFWDALLAAAEARITLPHRPQPRPPAGRKPRPLFRRPRPLRPPLGTGLDRRVAPLPRRCHRIHLVFAAERRRPGQRLPPRPRFRHPEPAAAHHRLPLLARRARAEGFRPFRHDLGNQVSAALRYGRGGS